VNAQTASAMAVSFFMRIFYGPLWHLVIDFCILLKQ